MANDKGSVGIVGLGPMGRNLAINFLENGETVTVYNRTVAKSQALAAEYPGRVIVAERYEDLVSGLIKPRRVIVLVSGGAKDAVLEKLYTEILEDGDVLLDFGNSAFRDTLVHQQKALKRNIALLSVGISGGKEGARNGASLMISGDSSSYDACRPLFQAVAAQYQDKPCELYLGEGAGGHFVKMVHNGIEYGLMQALAELYSLLAQKHSPSVVEQFDTIKRQTMLNAFLVDIVVNILRSPAPEPLNEGIGVVDVVDDAARQKGTGQWTVKEGVELGVPIPTLYAALGARLQSALVEERLLGSESYGDSLPQPEILPSLEELIAALELAFLVCFDQGFRILENAAELSPVGGLAPSFDLSAIAEVWRAGCIIRTALLAEIAEACAESSLPLVLSPTFQPFVQRRLNGLRSVVVYAASVGIPIPVFSSALAYIDTLRSARLPGAALTACLRDYFGDHGVSFHGTPQSVQWSR